MPHLKGAYLALVLDTQVKLTAKRPTLRHSALAAVTSATRKESISRSAEPILCAGGRECVVARTSTGASARSALAHTWREFAIAAVVWVRGAGCVAWGVVRGAWCGVWGAGRGGV